MQQGTVHLAPHKIPFPSAALFFTAILFSGTCEIDPPTTPPPAWEFSGDGKLAIIDGPTSNMTRLQLSFTMITSPPAKAAYEVFIFAGSDSLSAGPLILESGANAPRAQLTWDDPNHQRIFGRYDRLHLNLVGNPEARVARRSFSTWWSGELETKLRALFAESGAAIELPNLNRDLVTLGVDITTALTVDSAKAKGRRIDAQLRGWHFELGRLRTASAGLASGLPQFASTVAEIEQRSVASLMHADTLANLIDSIAQSQEDSLSFYNLIGFDLYAQAVAMQNQVAVIYSLCQRFAVLDIVIRPSMNRLQILTSSATESH